LNVRKQDGIHRAVSTTVVAVIIIIIVLASVAVYYVSTVTPSSSTTSSTSSTSATTPTSSTTATIAYKSTIVYGTTDAVQSSIDPADAYDYFGDEMTNNLGAPLVDYAPGTTDTSAAALQPALATSWTVSPDGLTYTFNLRTGVKYDTGATFNATDVVYSFNRDIALANPEGAPVGIGYSGIIASVTAPNANTVVFTLKNPWGPFLSVLTFASSYIVNPAKAPMPTNPYPGTMTGTINYTAGNPAASNPNGLGPYTLTEWTRQGTKDVEMKLTANPNYWNYPAYPKTQNIIIKFYPDSTSLAAAIKSGDVDLAYRQFATADIQSLQTTSGLKVWPSSVPFIQYLVIQEGIKPFDDPNVRAGLAAALNRTDLVDTVFAGTATPLYSQIPIGMAYHEDAFKTAFGAGPNYTLAKQYLAKAGFSSSNKLVVDLWYETTGHYPQSPDQAQVYAADWQKSGVITVNLHGADWATIGTNRHAGNMAVFIMGWYPDYIDPYDYTYNFFDSSGSSWLNYGYNSSTMNGLLHQALISSASQLGGIYHQIQALQATDVPIIPVYQGGPQLGAVTKTSVTGIHMDVTMIFRLDTLQETA